MDEVDPEIRSTFEKLGIPIDEQKMLAGVAVDAVFESSRKVARLEHRCIRPCGVAPPRNSGAIPRHRALQAPAPRHSRQLVNFWDTTLVLH